MTIIVEAWSDASVRLTEFHSKLQPSVGYQVSLCLVKRILPYTILFLASVLYGASITLGLALY